ncbi:MAG: pyridoxamine 5'-phosphate oxidase family protein, partial [Microbacteriaceae bacterium]|nr:pyridoxamine 5'-phosphate oxidase family protein [Microbacteriaceae bacterium]
MSVSVVQRTQIRTHPERAVPDEAEDILEKGLVAHVGFAVDGQPYVIPMLYHYENNTVYIHGQRGGRLPR